MTTLALSIVASTQDHDTQVTQVTSLKVQVLANGSRGTWRSITGNGRGALIYTRRPTSAVPSTQDHDTKVTQVSSGKEQILVSGSGGLFTLGAIVTNDLMPSRLGLLGVG